MLGFGARAVGDRGSDGDVRLTRVAVEERGEAGEQGHERRRVEPPTELAEARREIGRQVEAEHAAAEGLHGRTRRVGRQLARLHAGELRHPVSDLRVAHGAGEPLALPGGEIGELDRQLGEHGLHAAREREARDRELADEPFERPGVRDDVVHREEQGVTPRRQRDERRAEQGAGLERERARERLARHGRQFPHRTRLAE